MLLSTTKKLCPLFSLFIMAVGCGKNTTDNKDTPAVVTQGTITTETLVVSLDSAQGKSVNYKIPRNGITKLPNRLTTKSGSVLTKTVNIYYNMDPNFLKDDFEFRCLYKSDAKNSLYLLNCYNFDGDPFGDVTGQEFRLDEGKLIRMEYSQTTQPSAIEASYLVDWK